MGRFLPRSPVVGKECMLPQGVKDIQIRGGQGLTGCLVCFATKSIWVVHNPQKSATWCSKSDCPKLGRKQVYDVVLNEKQENTEGELENIILLGVTDEADIDEGKS